MVGWVTVDVDWGWTRSGSAVDHNATVRGSGWTKRGSESDRMGLELQLATRIKGGSNGGAR